MKKLWRFLKERFAFWARKNKIEGDQNPKKKSAGTDLKSYPFLKWAGGKGQMLKQYEAFFPAQFENFLEPFVGAGAVFFHLYNSGKIRPGKNAILIDSAEDLMNCFDVIKNKVELLIKILRQPKYANDEKQYYRIRAAEPADPVGKAARTIYLNKTCFNGLFRVNSLGKFNVPFGKYRNPLICDEENLRAVHQTLKNVHILCSDFAACLRFAGKGDFVYFDPPYQPLSQTSRFTGYTKDSFSDEDQERLAETYRMLGKVGCLVMLSNSDTPLVRKLYNGFRIEKVTAHRAINSKSTGRGKIAELVILNY